MEAAAVYTILSPVLNPWPEDVKEVDDDEIEDVLIVFELALTKTPIVEAYSSSFRWKCDVLLAEGVVIDLPVIVVLIFVF